MNLLLLLVVFAAPILIGAGTGVWVWWRDRRRLARAFARGRTENVVRFPQPVVPLPVLTHHEVG